MQGSTTPPASLRTSLRSVGPAPAPLSAQQRAHSASTDCCSAADSESATAGDGASPGAHISPTAAGGWSRPSAGRGQLSGQAGA
jgi:hypothetical protein